MVLDFGGLYQSGSTWKFTVWAGTDITLASAGSMVYQFGRGYWSCTIGDSTSTVYIGIGTKNDIGSITYSAGNALSQQARATWNSLQASGYTQAYAIGANDFEDWGRTGSAATALNSNSRAWMDGYNAYTSKVFFVNYGSASGCPTSSVPSANSCNPGLTADTIWYVSWSGVAYPLPEIYATSGANASQWKNLSIYSVNKGSGKFFFKGVMTQYGACSQRGGCSGTNNTPTAGWNQLNTSVNSDSRTVTTPGPPTDIYWS